MLLIIWHLKYTAKHFYNFQVPFYLGELTEKVAQDDRIQVIKIAQDQLKVSSTAYDIMQADFSAVRFLRKC